MHFCNFVYQHDYLHDCLFCKPLVEDKGARDTKKKSIYKMN